MSKFPYSNIFVAGVFLILAMSLFANDEALFQYISPRPGAIYISPQSSLVFRLDESVINKTELSQIKIKTSDDQGNTYEGKLFFANDQETIIFKPYTPLPENEKIRVELTLNISGEEKYLSYDFTTSIISVRDDIFLRDRLESLDLADSGTPSKIMGEMSVINDVAVPADFPKIDVDILQETAPGKIFITNQTGVPYLIIFENDGTPYFYWRLENSNMDFNLHPTGTLSIWNRDKYLELDSNYNLIDTLACGNGYSTDFHELQLLENGNYLIIAKDYQTVDMSALITGGNPNASVLGTHAQELDRAGNVVFEFRTWDHFDILDAIEVNLLSNSIDYCHMNSIAVDYDGHIITSSRHLSEVTKIDRQTGEIIWRLGGKNNQFEFVNDVDSISYQHDARPVPGQPDHYTIFDNGNYHSPRFSRAVEFVIDTTMMTATKVWEYRQTPDRSSPAMGNTQRLSNGNTYINWAINSLPKSTEVTPEGEIVYEMNFADNYSAYRTYRHEWEGKLKVPYLVAESYSDRVALIFNKFGDDQVAYYRIYADQSPEPTTMIDSTSNTWIELRNLENYQRYYFRVTAVNNAGEESGFSNQTDVLVNYVPPGENLLRNADFSEGGLNWALIVTDDVQATGGVENGQYRIQITNSVSDPGAVQLRQDNIELLQDRRYRLEFDGFAANSRTAEVRLQMVSSPHTDYSRIGSIALNQNVEHFSYLFTMQQTSDLESRLVFNVGNSTDDVYLDNISLIRIVSTLISDDRDNQQPTEFVLMQNYPNPFNPRTIINYKLPITNKVELGIYNILGQMVSTLVSKTQPAGRYEVAWDASGFASGVYYYKITAGDFQQVRKMLFIK